MALRSGRVGIHPSQVDPITGMLLNGPTPGSVSFEDLSDAQISNPEAGQTLQYNGTGWENVFASISPVTPATLASLQDVQITDPEDGALLVYDSASGKWVNSVTPPAPIVPDGNTVTPTDDVETWLSCAGIDDKSYTTLSDILSDSVTFNALLGDSNANKYMARSTTWASTLCADQYAMTMIGQYDVCCDALLANATWNTAINNSLYWNGHTDSGEKIHGANEEVAYYLDGATQVPISNPSTLDAGTYTFGSTVAKNPDSLSSDYTKQIRITPNTVEVVLRPDKSLYWWGYQSSDCEELSSANGWSTYSGMTLISPTFNTNNVNIASATNKMCGIGKKTTITASKVITLYQFVSGDNAGYMELYPSKSNIGGTATAYTTLSTTGNKAELDISSYSDKYLVLYTAHGRNSNINAMWYE